MKKKQLVMHNIRDASTGEVVVIDLPEGDPTPVGMVSESGATECIEIEIDDEQMELFTTVH